MNTYITITISLWTGRFNSKVLALAAVSESLKTNLTFQIAVTSTVRPEWDNVGLMMLLLQVLALGLAVLGDSPQQVWLDILGIS